VEPYTTQERFVTPLGCPGPGSPEGLAGARRTTENLPFARLGEWSQEEGPRLPRALARWVESLATLPVVAAPSSYATKGR
jgi:hypothetical protein